MWKRTRTEEEMLGLVLSVAEADEHVRAVAMNGSRTNPNAPRDVLQDYDIVYLVTEDGMRELVRDRQWVDVFGERIIMQTPVDASLFPAEWAPEERFSYLMQFTDGNRIDLTLIPIARKDAYLQEDKLTVILLDKDRCLPAIPAPTDEDYRVKRPTAAMFAGCCNEFWWVSTYVAKGLWRRELLYAQAHMNDQVRPMLIRMLEWQMGLQTDFKASMGKNGKYLQRYLPEPVWLALLSTYADGSYDGMWKALHAMGELFRSTATDVARRMHFDYRLEDGRRVIAYLRHVESLPADARAIFP